MDPKGMFQDASLGDEAKRYIELLTQKKRLKKELKDIGLELEQQHHALKTLMENNGLTSLKQGNVTLFFRPDFFMSCPEEHRETTFQWLRDNDLGYLIKETVHGKSLSTEMKKDVEEFTDPEQRKIYLNELRDLGFSIKDETVIGNRGIRA